jgi:hypothetical protein
MLQRQGADASYARGQARRLVARGFLRRASRARRILRQKSPVRMARLYGLEMQYSFVQLRRNNWSPTATGEASN